MSEMLSKEAIETNIRELTEKYGEWSSDIPLPHEIWTKGNQKVPHTRLKRIVQIAHDLSRKPLKECRVLDLGCLDGQFSIEFALQGADTVGVEIREANIRKGIFCKETLGLNNLNFWQGDVRNVSEEVHGRFEVIVCSGIFYHLTAEDAFQLVSRMFSMSDRLVIIDTHVALNSREMAVLDGHVYHGVIYREHRENATQDQKSRKQWASWDNPTSFWFTRPSLVNLLSRAGFCSVYEDFVPVHKNYGKPGLECVDRCTFIAVKEKRCTLFTSPTANHVDEDWPEHTLAYARESGRARLLFDRVLGALRRL